MSIIRNLILALSIFVAVKSFGATNIKVGVLAPEGTSWAKNLKLLSKEVEELTKGDIKIRIYFGGSQGDEPDVLRKIRLGQLQGGIFSGKTLGDINGDVRVMEIPFTFHNDREKAFKVLQSMTPTFNKKFNQLGFENIGFFEIGLVYLVSKNKIERIKDLYDVKIWTWTGDPIVESLIETMKLVSIPLALPDVLSALSTGIVEAAYSPPLAIVALQWNTKVKYFLDFPITYSVGAFLIEKKTWDKISPANKDIINKVSKKYFGDVSVANSKENEESKQALKGFGVEFVNFPQEDYKISTSLRADIVKKLQGKLFSPEVYKELETQIKNIK